MKIFAMIGGLLTLLSCGPDPSSILPSVSVVPADRSHPVRLVAPPQQSSPVVRKPTATAAQDLDEVEREVRALRLQLDESLRAPPEPEPPI
jgi:hypothetical protein